MTVYFCLFKKKLYRHVCSLARRLKNKKFLYKTNILKKIVLTTPANLEWRVMGLKKPLSQWGAGKKGVMEERLGQVAHAGQKTLHAAVI